MPTSSAWLGPDMTATSAFGKLLLDDLGKSQHGMLLNSLGHVDDQLAGLSEALSWSGRCFW